MMPIDVRGAAVGAVAVRGAICGAIRDVLPGPILLAAAVRRLMRAEARHLALHGARHEHDRCVIDPGSGAFRLGERALVRSLLGI